MEENEFIPVNQEKKSPAKKKKRETKPSKKGKGKKGNTWLDKFDTQKIATVFGSFFILFSFFLLEVEGEVKNSLLIPLPITCD